jgi:hypothetical protein
VTIGAGPVFSIGDEGIKQFESDLKTFADRAYPFATKSTVNSSAFKAMKIARDDLSSRMTLRNRFSIQSIQVEQTKTLNVKRQTAIVGSTADYMEDQEFGTTIVKRGKEGVQIATGYASGQEGQKRTRLPRRANAMKTIQLQKRRKRGGSRKQRNLVAIKSAAESGTKFVFLDLGRRKGIFKVTGGKRRPKIKMVHDMSRQSVVIPANPWLAPAVKETRKLVPGIYRNALIFQLKRQGLFKS